SSRRAAAGRRAAFKTGQGTSQRELVHRYGRCCRSEPHTASTHALGSASLFIKRWNSGRVCAVLLSTMMTRRSCAQVRERRHGLSNITLLLKGTHDRVWTAAVLSG